MPIRPNRNIVIPVIKLEDATSSNVEALIGKVPEYRKSDYKQLVGNTVGAIHQIPYIFKVAGRGRFNLDLKNIEAYFGRSSAGADRIGTNLSNRFRAGIDRGHEYGMVFAKTSIKNTLQFERLGISIIENLRRRDALCISNRVSYSAGGVGENEPGFLYLTFRFIACTEPPAYTLGKKEIDAAVDHVLDEIQGRVRGYQEMGEAAKVGFETANVPSFIGKYLAFWYDPEQRKWIPPSISPGMKLKTSWKT